MSYNAKTNWQNNEIVEAVDMNRIEQGITDNDTALQNKVDKEAGKGLSEANFTSSEKTKLAGIATGANKTVIANNLTTTVAGSALDATQGKALNDLVSTISDKRTARFVIGTSAAGWTASDCDYLCDGTADQTEINAAIRALPATGGEIVILDGTYNITAKIDVTKDNVSIRGNGNATILKRMFNSSVEEGVITLMSRSGCKIADLQVDGNKTSYTNSNNYGIKLRASSNNTITGNACNNNSKNGIYAYSSSNNAITGNTCNNNDNHGIQLYSSSNNNTVIGNTCNNNSRSGIQLYSASSNSMITGNTVIGNTCNNNSESGIHLFSSSNSCMATGNTVIGNTCNNNDNHGIYLRGDSKNNAIIGNTCIRGTGLATDYTKSQYTILLEGTDNGYNLIAMNNCMGKAVTKEGGTGNTLVNNKFDAT